MRSQKFDRKEKKCLKSEKSKRKQRLNKNKKERKHLHTKKKATKKNWNNSNKKRKLLTL